IVDEEAGGYRVTVRAWWSGEYSISSSIPHETTETDKKYRSAQTLYLQAMITIPGTPGLSFREKTRKRLEKLEERLAIYRTTDDPKSVAISLTDVAPSLGSVGEYSKMLGYYKEAMEIFRSIDKPAEECAALIAMANDATYRMADYQKAIDYLNSALDLSRVKAYKYGESRALYQLGAIYQVLADEQKALDFYHQSAAIVRLVPSPPVTNLDEAVTLSTIGSLYANANGGERASDPFKTGVITDPQKAITYFQQALEIYRDLKSKGHRGGMVGEASMLLNIGNAYKTLGSYAQSLNYLEQSLKLQIELRYRPGQANALRSIGNLYVLRGEYQTGFQYNSQAWEIQKANANAMTQAQFLNSIAKDHDRAGETQKALDLYNDSLALSRPAQQLGNAAASLFEIARIERQIGNFANARSRIEEAIAIVESIRARIAVQEIRATYFATVKKYYDFYIDLLMQAQKAQPDKGFDALALQTSEKSRARGLLDLLSLARVDIRKGVDQTLLDREQQARERLVEKAYKQNLLLLGKPTEEEAEKVNQEVTVQTDVYRGIQAEIRNKSPRYAALTQPSSLSTNQIQELLDSGTVLLEYSLGEKKSYLWAVSSDSVTSFDLPGRDEIEKQARKAYELMTERNRQVKGETVDQTRARAKAADAEYPKVAAALSEMLLGPAADLIRNKRLVIVPDGALSYIPFSALPLPKQEPNPAGLVSLGTHHEVVTLPSASTLARLREETAGRNPAAKMVAIFADPVFSQLDSRTDTPPLGKQPAPDKKSRNLALTRDFERAVSDVGLAATETGGLPRLLFSRREADSIFKISPRALSLKQVDFGASKEQVFGSNLEQYRILHFATHGLLNSQHPELSGVVLSLVDKNGGDVDGFLRLQDIYNLKLNADLVVLSACNTALGKEVKGEGLIGLTRGFMYAGAPRVIASLWKVDDAATAELMSIFYRKMLTDNLRPAAALRAAQTEMMKQSRWRSPYYWAPFVLQGEWK
ncbi:MAG: CHAT domain-containing tetratricopeptide repeat protein, partial [Pyrinomonadaceae bacterium]